MAGSLADVTRRAVMEVERVKIDQALKEAGGNRGRAAELLQVGFKTLMAKLREHGLES
jgi:DNA-binding NtrC family response regulator